MPSAVLTLGALPMWSFQRWGIWPALAVCSLVLGNPVSAAAQTLAVAVGDIGTTLDTRTFQGNALPILNSTQEALFEYGYKPTSDPKVELFDNSRILPALGESYEILPGKEIRVKLRPARSAAGNVLGSADVVWTVQRNVALNTLGAYALRQMGVNMADPVTAVDEHTVRFNVSDARTPAEHFLTWWILAPFDSVEARKHATAEDPWATIWLSTHTAAFGPYHIKTYRYAESAILERNPNYWGALPAIGTIVIRAVPDAGSRQQLLQAGQVQYVPDLPRQQLRDLQANAGSDITISYVPFTRMSYMDFNVTVPPLDKAAVRQAVSYALPYDALLGQVYGGNSAQRVTGPLPDLLNYPNGQGWPFKQDLEKAKALLASAGLPNGFAMQLHYCLCNPGPEMQQVAVLIQNALAQAGIRVELRQEPSNAVFQAGLLTKRFPVALASVSPFAADAGFMLVNMIGSSGAQNNGGYANTEIDRLLTAINAAPNGPQRAALIDQVTKIWIDEVPFADLLQPDLAIAFSKALTGYKSHASGHAFFKYFRFAN